MKWSIAIAAWVLAAILALFMGAVSDASWELIWDFRVPRILLASAIGAGLAVAGCVLQVLFNNPLCEPYTLGISSGSALGAVIGVSLGLSWQAGGVVLPAFIGALLFGGILFLLARRRGLANLTLLLTGVMLGFLGSSLVALWMALADERGIQAAFYWLMGDLSRAEMQGALIILSAVGILLVAIWSFWKKLDWLLLGETNAQGMGVDVVATRRSLIFLVSLLIGVCVSAGGMIGFVGLVIPHFSRRLVGGRHFALLPFSALWGAVALVFADALSRGLFPPQEIPVGVVTALVGAPLLGYWLVRTEKGWFHA